MKSKLYNIIYYASGAVIIGYLLISIGFENIVKTIQATDIVFLLSALSITIIATLIRYFKLRLILNDLSLMESLNVFLFSRLGRELSFAGYFIPLLKKNFRKSKTAEDLIVDRYTEVFSTLLIGLICSFFLFQREYLYYLIIVSIGGAFLFSVIFPFVNIGKLKFKRRFFLKIQKSLSNIQEPLKFNRIFFILASSSIISTILDFVVVYILIISFDVDVEIMAIPVIWAASALLAILLFVIMGTTEFSMIYLYERYAGVGKDVTLSYIIVSRIINFLCIILLAMVYYILEATLKLKNTLNGETITKS